MYEELQNKTVKCRKPHECAWCAERINKGEQAQYRAYVWGEADGIQHDWMHPECHTAMKSMDWRITAEGWNPGDYGRGQTQ